MAFKGPRNRKRTEELMGHLEQSNWIIITYALLVWKGNVFPAVGMTKNESQRKTFSLINGNDKAKSCAKFGYKFSKVLFAI